MARATPSGPDVRRFGVETAHAIDGEGEWCECKGPTWFAVSGTFTGAAITVEISFDGGTTAIPMSADTAGAPLLLAEPGAMVIPQPESGLLMRTRCEGILSGTATARLSGG